MQPLGEALGRLEKLDPAEVACKECGESYMAERYNWPVRVPREDYPQYTKIVYETRIVGGGLCPNCQQAKAEERRKLEEAARIAEFAGVRRKARLACGIEAKYQDQDFSTFKTDGLAEDIQRAYKRAWEYAEGFPIEEGGKGYQSLVLFSANSWGVGKTHLAGAIAHRVLDRWTGEPPSCPVRFISEPELLLRITATYNYSPEEKPYRECESDIINSLIAVPLLIIDDVGKRKAQDLRFVQRIHFSIIDGRYKRMRPVVLTANLDSEGLGRYLGGVNPSGAQDFHGADEATLDRLIEMCRGRFNQIEGKSYRRYPGTSRDKGRA
ncbi:MAG: ATP-binding protein [Syntrophales bacterium]|nr:ATP-binding protein [Syntrophales bacterium]